MNQDQILHVLRSFAGDDEFRPVFLAPFEYRDYVCASNTYALIRVSKDLAPGDFSTKYCVPDIDKIIPPHQPIFIVTLDNLRLALIQAGIDYNRSTTDCPHCKGEGIVEWTFTDNDDDTHTKDDDCPCCDGSGELPNGFDKLITLGEFTFVGSLIRMLYEAMGTLALPRAEVSISKQTHRFRLSDKVDVALMPTLSTKKRPNAAITTTPVNPDKITPATRAEAREAYRSSTSDEFEEGFDAALRSNYGHHNLTSDTEPETKETMEVIDDSRFGSEADKEKELDLCDLLKGCEGAEIFLPDEGKCTIHKVTHTQVIITCGTRTIHLCDESLLIAPTGFAYAYPSKESFLANPLNAKAAWMEWKEARKPKYILQAELQLISNTESKVDGVLCCFITSYMCLWVLWVPNWYQKLRVGWC